MCNGVITNEENVILESQVVHVNHLSKWKHKYCCILQENDKVCCSCKTIHYTFNNDKKRK